MKLEDLKRLEQAAPPLVTRYGPSPGGRRYQFATPDDNAALIVYGAALADVTEAARNALPALLRVAEAAREWERVTTEHVNGTADEVIAARRAARAELRAALAALEDNAHG